MLNEAQLKSHYAGIGGSLAPAIVGVDQHKTALEAYLEITDPNHRPDLSENEAVIFGTVLEEPIAREAARRLDVQIRRVNTTLRHKTHPFIVAHPDRLIVGKKEGLEVKNRSFFMGKNYGDDGSDEVIESEIIQCQHYMAVTGYVRWHLAVLLGGQRLRLFTIERDEDLIASLVEFEANWWRDHIEAGIPPEVDCEHPKASELLTKLYPGTTGEIIELPEQATHWSQVEREAAELESQYRKTRELAQNHLKSMMADAAIALLPDGTGYTRKEVKKKGFVAEPTRYINFRFSKNPKGAK